MPAIQVNNLKKYYQIYKKEPGFGGSLKSFFKRKYETIKAVDGVSFEIKEGELIGFIGPNGAGKTTVLKCLSGLLYPTNGYLSVLGYTPSQRKSQYLKQISLVMGQKNQLWWDLPAIETFLLNKEVYEIPQKQFEQTLDELTSLLDIKELLRIQVRKLSLGQRMKCELAVALLHSPKILFLDEPTIGLDVVSQKIMRDFIKDYNSRKKSTIILTSHYMDDVKELCRRVIIIDKGSLIFDGLLSEIYEKYADHKVISAVFSKEVDFKKLEKIGLVKEVNPPRSIIWVKREAVSAASAELLQNFPVEDLNIEEVPIESIIREIFAGNKEN